MSNVAYTSHSLTEAFRLGKESFTEGLSAFMRDNPYPTYTPCWHAWRSGYIEATFLRFFPGEFKS